MHYRILLAVLLFAALFQQHVCAQQLILPDIGDPSRQYLSGKKEYHLGAQVMQRLRDRGLVIDDVQLNEYLLSVAQRLANYADQGQHGYTFYWIDAPSVNAFATPGGFVGMHSGLLLATEDESEFAGVLAHEISHVSQRHIARAYADSQRLSLPMAAAMLASMAIAAADPQAGRAALTGAMALNAQRRINMTRANEQEADRIGLQLLGRAGFDAGGMARFFAKLQRMSGSSAGQIPEYLLTHPRPTSRLADTEQRLENDKRIKKRRVSHDRRLYFLAKARTQVLTTPNTNRLLKHFKLTLSKRDYQDEIAERYGYMLALKRAGRYKEAQRQLARIMKAEPDRLAFRIEQAELALARGDGKRAWKIFEQAKKVYGNDFSLAMHYAHALTTHGSGRSDGQKAMKLLQAQLKRRPRNILLYERYAQAAQRAGDRAMTHAAMAEYYYLSGDLKMALQQTELGLRQSGATPYQQAQLRAKLRRLKEEKATN